MNTPLQRFVDAQERDYARALAELRRGRKESHWMWYIFPPIEGLGRSATARRYAIAGADEAAAYLAHPVLGERLRECCRTLLSLEKSSADAILGQVDALKLRSCMTLFGTVSEEPVFQQVLDRYYGGQPDEVTLALLARQGEGRY
jgi:uncharacterized protein (DUF1810 family)